MIDDNKIINVSDLVFRRSVSSDRPALLKLMGHDNDKKKIGPYLSNVNPYGENVQNKYTVAMLDDKIVAAVDLRLSKRFVGYELVCVYLSNEHKYETNFGIKLLQKILTDFRKTSQYKVYVNILVIEDNMCDLHETDKREVMLELGFKLLVQSVCRHVNGHTEGCVSCERYKTKCCSCHHDLYVY